MRPLPTTPLPRRIRRRARRAVVPAAVTAALVAGGVTTVASPVEAAPEVQTGTFTVGAAPVALNQPVDPGMGSLTPAADAAQNGMYGPQVAWPVIPLSVALARNGHLVSYGTPLDSNQQGGLTYDDWDTSAGWERSAHRDLVSMNDYNSFCNAIVELADGRMLMVGGNSDMSSMIYDPDSGTQVMGQNINRRRWYATSLRLTDGRILVLGGADAYNSGAYLTPDNNAGVATTPEIGTGTGAWTALTGATSLYAFGADRNRWWYPRAFNAPNGTVVGFSGDHLWTLQPDGDGKLTEEGTLPYNPGVSASQVMYAPGKILIAGGGQTINSDEEVGSNSAVVLDVNGATPSVTATSPMNLGRNWLNLTVLPNGEVFANGGTRVGTDGGDGNSVKQTEVWNPATGQWRTAATAQRTRTYHQTALVLPSGAVFTGGGGSPGPEDNLNAELYYPSYLFTKGADGAVQWASRPAISSIAGSATHGGTVQLTVADGRAIGAASLISDAAETHGQATDQRRIPLQITQQGDTVTATLPDSVNTMPAGDYELTVVDRNGVPSAAQIITIRNGAAGSVTVPNGGVVAAPGGAGDPGTGDPGTGDPGTGAGDPGTGDPGTGTGTGTGTTAPAPKPSGTVPLTVDKSVGLESVNKPGYRIRHVGTATRLQHVTGTKSKTVEDDTSWTVRTGLASSGGVSFESVDEPGYYLAAPAKGAGAVRLVRGDGSRAFAGRATFARVNGVTGQNTSFRVWADRSLVLRHVGTAVVVRKFDASNAGRFDSTFSVRAGLTAARPVPLAAGRSIGLESAGHAGYRLRHAGATVTLSKATAGSSRTLQGQTSWIVRSGLSSAKGVSFESADRPGWFLTAPKHGSGALALVKRAKSAAFAARATFTRVTGVTGHSSSFRLRAHPSLFVEASALRLTVGALVRTRSGKAAATFAVHSGLSPAPTK